MSERSVAGIRVLDLGCGEGKNSYALAVGGASVEAVDCSELAIANGKRALDHPNIRWTVADAGEYLRGGKEFDLLVMYGLLHCLPSKESISDLISLGIQKTAPNGHHILAAFNDGPQDLSAHPGFTPTLAPHDFFLEQYRRHSITSESNSVIYETHPHNNIPHSHSITRLVARIAS